VGFLKVPAGFRPLLIGALGRNDDAPARNVSGVLAMIAALDLREQQIARGEIAEKLAIRQEFESALAALSVCRSLVPSAERLWNTVSVMMPATLIRANVGW
jgi:hypothetical protein